jgi:hypothetical protein
MGRFHAAPESACEWEGSMLHQRHVNGKVPCCTRACMAYSHVNVRTNHGLMECSCHAWRCPDKQHGQVVRGEMRSTQRYKTTSSRVHVNGKVPCCNGMAHMAWVYVYLYGQLECLCHTCESHDGGQTTWAGPQRHKTRCVGVSTHQPCGRVVAGRHVHLHACNDCLCAVHLMFEDTNTRWSG